MPKDGIVILDFGSQYTQLIARKIRSNSVFSQILPCTASREEISVLAPKGIVLSGGPSSVYEKDAPSLPDHLWSFGVPVLGICYGMHLVAQHLGVEVIQSSSGEYGLGRLRGWRYSMTTSLLPRGMAFATAPRTATQRSSSQS